MTDNNNKYKSFIAVVVAAGLSERMGRFKPLLDICGRPALVRLIDTIKSSGIGITIVVTGHEHEVVEDALSQYTLSFINQDSRYSNEKNGFFESGEVHRLLTINNPNYKEGMFSSVKTGIREVKSVFRNDGFLAERSRAALLFPADIPLLSVKTIEGLISSREQFLLSNKKAEAASCPFAVPVFEGRNGHPLLIPEKYFDEILAYEGKAGLKGIRSLYDNDMIKYKTDDKGCVLDMDTPEDYERLLEYYRYHHEQQ